MEKQHYYIVTVRSCLLILQYLVVWHVTYSSEWKAVMKYAEGCIAYIEVSLLRLAGRVTIVVFDLFWIISS